MGKNLGKKKKLHQSTQRDQKNQSDIPHTGTRSGEKKDQHSSTMGQDSLRLKNLKNVYRHTRRSPIDRAAQKQKGPKYDVLDSDSGGGLHHKIANVKECKRQSQIMFCGGSRRPRGRNNVGAGEETNHAQKGEEK